MYCKVNRVFGKQVKASKLGVSISSSIPRNGNWNNKVMEVNGYLSNDSEFLLSVTQLSTSRNI